MKIWWENGVVKTDDTPSVPPTYSHGNIIPKPYPLKEDMMSMLCRQLEGQRQSVNLFEKILECFV